MDSKTIIIQDINRRRKSWTIGNQAALESLLRRYQVDALLEESPYSCEVTQFTSLAQGGKYILGDSFLSSVELQEYSSSKKQ